MNSFFAEDQGWPNILADEALQMYWAARNPTTAGETATQLLNGGDPVLWAQLQAVMKNGSISPETRVSIRELVISADFEKLWKEKPEMASIALIFASIHACRLGSKVIERVRGELLKLAAAVGKDDEASKRERTDGTLLSATFYLYKPPSILATVVLTTVPDRFDSHAAVLKLIRRSMCSVLRRRRHRRKSRGTPSVSSTRVTNDVVSTG